MAVKAGAVTSAIEALFLLGNDAYFTGRWDEVQALTDEGLACASSTTTATAVGRLFLQAWSQLTAAIQATSRP